VTTGDRTRYVLALGDDAARVRDADGTAVVLEVDRVVLVEADIQIAVDLAREGEYVHVFSSPHDAHRAFALFHAA
jgi:hypothetical protein